MTRLPFPARAVRDDSGSLNASFHYSEDYEASLREALRCLKPGGTALVISDSPLVLAGGEWKTDGG